MTAAVDMKALALSVRLADAILRPIDRLEDEALATGTLTASELRAMARHPAFARPINRALRQKLAADRHALGRPALARLATARDSRLALVLVTERGADVRRFALILAGAILHKRVAGLVLKRDRQAAEAALGPDGFHVAAHEAPVMHGALAELDRLPAGGAPFEADAAPAPLDRPTRFGLQALARFVEAAEPDFAPFFLARLPAAAEAHARHEAVGEPRPLHRDHIVKLARRRLASWSAIIG